jgi:hypothetical protein
MTKSLTMQELFELARDRSAEMFHETGEVLPMWHAVAGNGDNILIATPWCNDDEKDAAMHALRALFASHQVKRYAFMVEAWMVVVDHGNIDGVRTEGLPRPSEHPDRREMLRVTVEDRSGEMLSGHYFILRPEHGKPTLSPFHTDDYTAVTGRMTGLLT